jgi:hypothetical protein
MFSAPWSDSVSWTGSCWSVQRASVCTVGAGTGRDELELQATTQDMITNAIRRSDMNSPLQCEWLAVESTSRERAATVADRDRARLPQIVAAQRYL